MKLLPSFVVLALGVFLAGSARAQRADRVSNPRSSPVRTSASNPPASTVHASGSTKSIQIAFGPYVTQTGVGAGGANVSELYTAQGFSTFGYGMQSSLGTRVAEEFTICDGRIWNPDVIKWLTYQTGAATTGPGPARHEVPYVA